MYGNGCAGIHRQRRQHREDLVQELLAQLDLALRPVLVADDPDVLRRQLLARCRTNVSRVDAPGAGARDCAPAPAPAGADSPSGEGAECPAATCCLRPATRTWKNSSRLLAKMARNRDPLQQRVALVLRLVQHPRVELQPRQLPVDVREPAVHARRSAADGGLSQGGHDTRTPERGPRMLARAMRRLGMARPYRSGRSGDPASAGSRHAVPCPPAQGQSSRRRSKV